MEIIFISVTVCQVYNSEVLIKKLDELDLEKYILNHKIDTYTLEDIVKCLKQPNRDFRDDFPKPLLKSNILKIEDLKRGMESKRGSSYRRSSGSF